MSAKPNDPKVQRERRTLQQVVHARPQARQGSIFVLTAILVVVMMGFVGLVVDVGHQMTKYRQAQNAADAAALAAAFSLYTGGDFTAATQQAKLLVRRNGFQNGDLKSLLFCVDKECAPPPPTNPQSVGYVKAIVDSSFSTYFAGVLGIGRQSVAASATASLSAKNECELCALNPTAQGAITLSGNGNINAADIDVIDNSADTSSSGALTLNGGTFNDPEGSIGVVGSWSGSTTPVPTHVGHVVDPLGWLVPLVDNNGNSLIYQSQNTSGSTKYMPDPQGISACTASCTIQPGIYDNITVNAGPALTMAPGIYVITGTFSTNGSASVSANGVMLYMGCSGNHNNDNAVGTSTAPLWVLCGTSPLSLNPLAPNPSRMGQLSLAGSGTLNLSAMSTFSPQYPNVPAGYDNLLIYQDRADMQAMTISGNGSASSAPSIVGSVYSSAATVSVAGNGNLGLSMDSLFIADQLKLTGSPTNGSLTMSFDPSKNAKAPPAPRLWR